MLAEQLRNPEIQTSNYELSDLSHYFEGQVVEPFFLAEAHQILLANRLKTYQSGPEATNSLPLPIDVLSVSDVMVRDNCEDYLGLKEALFMDSLRMVGEARRKYSWEYFAPLFQSYNASEDDLVIGSRSLNQILENGLSPFCDEEEQEIRALEYKEHKTNIELVNKCQTDGGTITLLSVKECPDFVIKKFQDSHDEKDTYNGYVPQVEKFMLRRYVITGDGVFIDQMALPGTLIDQEVKREALEILSGNEAEYRDLSALELRGRRFIMSNEPNSLIELVKLLDHLASQKHNQPVFMGEVVREDDPKDYDQIYELSEKRNRQNETIAREVADFLLKESKEGNDSIISELRLTNFLTTRLFEEHKTETVEIKHVFGIRVSQNLDIINTQFALTNNKAIYDDSIKDLVKTLPPAGFCGAGSCGLVGVEGGSSADKTLSSLGLKGEKLADTVRKCPFCGKKTVFYDMNASKACLSCKKTELKK